FLFLFSTPSLALIPGDFGSANNGPPDGVVDFEDLMIFAMAYGTTPSDSNWNSLCDIAGSNGSTSPDGVIDFEDLMIFAMNYGRTDKVTGVVAEAWTHYESEGISHLINVFWHAYSGADGYKVYRIVNGIAEEEPIYSGPGELHNNVVQLLGHDTNVVVGSTYSYYIIAYGDFGETAPSDETVTIDTSLPSCSLVDPIDGTQINEPNFSLTWSPVGPGPYEGSIDFGKTELWVYDMTLGEEVWFIQFDDMATSTITYNQYGQATPLVNGHRYQWNFWCYGFDVYGREIAISASETWEFTYTGESMGAIRGVVELTIEDPMIEPRTFPGAARIDILGTEQFTISSFSDGTYALVNIPVGIYTIRAFKHGFISAQQIVNVVEGQAITDINFDLVSEVQAGQLSGIYYLGFNLDNPPFDNLKVRQALNYAIDKQTLVDEFNAEFGLDREVAQGPIPPSMIGYNSSLIGYTYDINQAEVLLSQAGYPDGFSTDLYFNEYVGHRFIAEKIKIYLAQIGVAVEIHGIEGWTNYVTMIYEGELPFFRVGWGADTPDPVDLLYALYHSESNYNHCHYSNLIVDNQIEQAWEIIDDVSFIQLVQQIEETVVEEAPATFLYYN
ncbi:MAG: ABC transporter substrate-binding protein, partial [Candidatus Heimdallarchaeota archaeon]